MLITPITLRAFLVSADACTAVGITATGYAPVLALCRLLIAAGHDPRGRLDVFRGNVLALRIRSIGEAARLEIDGHGVGFRPAQERAAAPPMRSGTKNGGGHG